MVDAIFFIIKTGVQWRNLPDSFNVKWNSVYYYFRKWQNKSALINELNNFLVIIERKAKGKDSNPTLLLVDSQSVKLAPLVSEERGFDGNKRVNGRKKQLMTDTNGLVIAVHVHAVNGSDTVNGVRLIEKAGSLFECSKKILVDQGYCGTFTDTVKEKFKKEVEVSTRPEGVTGFIPDKFRWAIERTFGWFNYYRRLSKDYERTTASSEAMILRVNCAVILNRVNKRHSNSSS